MYKLIPLGQNIVVEPIKASEVKDYTGKTLTGIDTNSLDVLQYGKVITSQDKQWKSGEIILYEKLASHKTNIGEPRVVLVNIEHIHGRLTKES